MRSPKRNRLLLALALSTQMLLVACATVSPTQPAPLVIPGGQLTPLPASVTEIDLKSSGGWREKVKNYLLKLEAFLASEMPK